MCSGTKLSLSPIPASCFCVTQAFLGVMGNEINVFKNQREKYSMGKGRFTVVSMQNSKFILLLLLLINYCIIFHKNNRAPAFAHSCIMCKEHFPQHKNSEENSDQP